MKIRQNIHLSVILCSMKITHLRGRKVNERVQRQGAVWKGATMVIRRMAGAPRHLVGSKRQVLYVGTAASAKLNKSAVKRNRMRRRCREAIRTIAMEYDTLPVTQLLVAPRSSSLDCDYEDIRQDVRNFLTLLQSCPPNRKKTASSNS